MPPNTRGSQPFACAANCVAALFGDDEFLVASVDEWFAVECEPPELALTCDEYDEWLELACADPPEAPPPWEDPPDDLPCAFAWIIVKLQRKAAEAKIETNRDVFLMAASLLLLLTFHSTAWLPLNHPARPGFSTPLSGTESLCPVSIFTGLFLALDRGSGG